MLQYYRDLNFKNIFTPKFKHLLFLLFWPCYLTLFVLTEKYVVAIHTVYHPVDDLIPFCEFFVVPYVLWYAMLAFVSLYTLFFDIKNFKRFHAFLCISSLFAFASYILFPNMQQLRPQEFARDNLFVDIMKNLYAADTNTNVCPSLHVVFSLGMLFTLWNSKHFKTPIWRVVFFIFTVLVCLATVFLKQHSVVDIFAGVILSFLIFPFIFLDKQKASE